MLLFSAPTIVRAVLGRRARGLPGRGAGLLLTGVSGVELLVVSVSTVVVVVGVFVFLALGRGAEAFPGAGGGAVFRALSREVGIFPGRGGEADLESLWEGVGFLPDNGAGAVLTEVGLEVVAAFLDGGTTVFLLGCRVFGGGCGRLGVNLLCLGLVGEPGFFAAPAPDVLVVVVVVAVVVIVAAMVGFGVVGL